MKAWDNFLALQEAELGVETVSRWLRSLKVLRFDAGNLYLEAKDSFHALWFEEHIRHKLQTKFINNNNRRIRVHLSVVDHPKSKTRRRQRKGQQEEQKSSVAFSFTHDDLDPHCSFENLVVSEGNKLAEKLLYQVSEGKASEQLPDLSFPPFNPIYLYGPKGTGKTHLLMATAHRLRDRGLRVIYSRAETFTEHVVSAIRAGEMATFRQAYRNIDVLLIEDVHVFSRKGATQEELFHTFNTLHVAGKQIILSAYCSPQELQLIEPRLISRFEWGIVLPLPSPDDETIREIAKKKAEAFQFSVNPKVLDFLIETFTSSPKAVTRALEALVLRAHLNTSSGRPSQKVTTASQAQKMLADLIEDEQKGAVTPQKVIQVVAEFYGIRSEDIISKSQSRECVLPRQLAMHVCRSKLNMPYMKIGDVFSRDHSTVMSAVRRVQKELDHDHPEILGSIKSILKKLDNHTN